MFDELSTIAVGYLRGKKPLLKPFKTTLLHRLSMFYKMIMNRNTCTKL